jgi:hypothetical protein
MAKSADKVSADFSRNPMGLARILAHGFVTPLVNIRDIDCGSLRALSQNRDSAAGVS